MGVKVGEIVKGFVYTVAALRACSSWESWNDTPIRRNELTMKAS